MPINRVKISISYKVSMYTCCCFILFCKFKLQQGCTRGEQRLEGNCKPGKTEIAMSEIQIGKTATTKVKKKRNAPE